MQLQEDVPAKLQEDALANLQEEALAQQEGQTRRPNPSATRRENSSCLVSIYCQFSVLAYHFFVYAGKMTISTKLDEKLEGVDNLRAWKYRVMLTLEEKQSGRVH